MAVRKQILQLAENNDSHQSFGRKSCVTSPSMLSIFRYITRFAITEFIAAYWAVISFIKKESAGRKS